MLERESETLSFDEDGFDMEAHKKTAAAQAKSLEMARRSRRKISKYKLLIMLLAFVAACLLYNAASEIIYRIDYNKYHNVN